MKGSPPVAYYCDECGTMGVWWVGEHKQIRVGCDDCGEVTQWVHWKVRAGVW